MTRHDNLTKVKVSTPAPPTPGATRMRRYRDRRKRGGMLIEIELSPDALDDLVALHWLDPAKRQDADAVAAAVILSLEVLSAGVPAVTSRPYPERALATPGMDRRRRSSGR
jgi:hypothetical protein